MSKKTKKESKEFEKAFEDDHFGLNFKINNLETLRSWINLIKPNPLEKVMAINLLTAGYEFVSQKEFYLPEGWIINGRKKFIIDFYLPEYKIAIETDGKIHNQPEQVLKDNNRDNCLTMSGIYEFRFGWDDVMGTNKNFDIMILIDTLVKKIKKEKGGKTPGS